MKIDKIVTVFFSPTGTSQKVAQAIASGCGDIPREVIDLTHPGDRAARQLAPTELAVIAVPVYAGRLPAVAVERLQAITGCGTPAVIVAVYGNRAYEDALLELRDIVERARFFPVAAAAFIGEHSFSNAELPIGAGRPDSDDLTRAAAFGTGVVTKLAAMTRIDSDLCPQIPGQRPYKEGMKNLPFTPSLVADLCSHCGLCVTTCPTGAVTLEEQVTIAVEQCIFCCSCLKNCPEQALKITAPPILQTQQTLHDTCSERKEIELFG
ncbi:MAG: 4Fe-4S binding protein [Desulfopila sp.]